MSLLQETRLFGSTSNRMALGLAPRVRLGDVLSEIKAAADAAMLILNAYLTNQCTQAGVAAVQCASFSQQATLLQTQLNNAFVSGDLITLGLVANQIYQLNGAVKDAIDKAKETPGPITTTTTTTTTSGTSPWVYVVGGLGAVGIIGLIIYGVTRKR